MKYYKNQNGQVYAFEADGSQDYLIKPEYALMTSEEVEQHLAPELKPVEVVEMAQARLALLNAGHLAKVDPIIEAMPEPQRTAARIEWEYRARVRRDSDLTQAIAAAIPLSDAEMDQLFTTAATL